MDIRMQDGTLLKGIPEGTTKEEILAKYEGRKAVGTPSQDEMNLERDKLQAAKASAQSLGTMPPVSPLPKPSMRGELAKSFSQITDALGRGATLGFGDEAKALGRSLAPGTGTYAEEMTRGKQRQQQFAKDAPGVQGTAELIGGGAMGGQLLKNIKGLLPLMAAGAGEGAVAGAGYAEPGQRGKGAAVGGALGGILPLPIAGAQRGGGAIRSALQARKPVTAPQAQQKAGDILMGRILEEGGTPGGVATQARKLGPQATVADVTGAPGQSLLDVVAQSSPATRKAISGPLSSRGGQTVSRTAQGLEDITGKTAVESEILGPKLMATRRANADVFYKEAYASPLNVTEEMERFLERPIGRQALKNAIEMVENEGGKVNWVGEGERMRPEITTRMADYIKKGFGKPIRETRTGPLQTATEDTQRAIARQDEWSKMVKDQSPKYAKATEIYAGDTAIASAHKEGSNLSKMKPAEMRKWWSRAGDSEREAFRYGAVEEIVRTSGENARGATGVLSKLDDVNMRDKLDMVFGKEQAGKIGDLISREATFSTTEAAARSGAKTGMAAAAAREFPADALSGRGAMPHAYEAASVGGHGGALYAARQALNALRTVKGVSPEVRDALGQKLLSSDGIPEMMREISNSHIDSFAKGKIMKDLARQRVNMLSGAGAVAAPVAAKGLLDY